MAEIRFTVRARRDLIDIWLEVSETDPAVADDLYNRLEARVEILRRFPESGPVRPDLAPKARILIELPYLILCRIIPEGVQIVRVVHSARNIGGILFTQGME
jgi:toxin ParE1/3/4